MSYKSCRYKRKRMRFHIAVWIEAFGDIPKGYCIHHKNGNKRDNTLENLCMMLMSEHKRLHAKSQKRNKKGMFA